MSLLLLFGTPGAPPPPAVPTLPTTVIEGTYLPVIAIIGTV